MSLRQAPDLSTLLWASLLGTVSGLLACAAPSTETQLELVFDGCLYVTTPVERPTCVLDEAAPDLRLWVSSSPGFPIEVTAGDESWHSSAAVAVQSGYLFRLENLDAPRLLVRSGSRSRSLRLRREAKSPFDDDSPESEERRRSWLTQGVPDEQRAFWLEWLAWAFETDENARTSALAEAARAHRPHSRRSAEIRLLLTVHFYLFARLDRPVQAAEILHELPEAPSGDGRSAILAAYYRGSWAVRTGRYDHALQELNKAKDQAERLQLKGLVTLAEQDLVHALVRLGRYDQALGLLSRLRAQGADENLAPCDLTDLLTDIGWSELLMSEAGLDIDPGPTLRQAQQALASCRSPKRSRRWNVEINLALAELAAQRLDSARRHLDAARELDPKSWWSSSWQRETEARLALAAGEPRIALALYDTLRRAESTRFNAGLAWRAAIGAARAHEALGQTEAALVAYEEAEQRAFRASLSLPFDASRTGQLYQRETRYHLELLVKLGRLGDALRVTRRSLGRHLRKMTFSSRLQHMPPGGKIQWDSLVSSYWSHTTQVHHLIEQEEVVAADQASQLRAQRRRLETKAAQDFDRALALLDDDALVPDPEPPPRQAGELLLVYHPSTSGWLGLAADDAGIEAAFIDDHGRDPSKWISPFATKIRSASRIRVLPYGPLWRLSFHTLFLDGKELLEHAEVVYSLDLPAPAGQPGTAVRRALLVSSPEGSLAHAKTEVETISRLLRQRDPPWEVHRHTELAEVRRALEAGYELLHFAGHGELVSWEADSGLIFGRGFGEKVRLTIRDILALSAVPEMVVLSACNSTLPVSAEEPSSLGVGHAFLLAGSRSVVGSLEPIADDEARAAMELFYREFQGPGTEARALRAVQLTAGASPEWKKLRVVER